MGIRDYIASQDSLEKKLFWIVVYICLAVSLYSTIVTISEHVSIVACTATSLTVVLLVFIMSIAHVTKQYVNCYMALCLVLNVILIPVNYFFCGGVYSGMPMYFVMGIFLCAFCLARKRTIVCVVLSATAAVVSILVSMFHKDLVVQVSEDYTYSDCLVSYLIVAAGIVAISLFVQVQYKRQRYKEINNGIIDILGTVVEFRSVEAGDHIKRIKGFTRILLSYVNKVYDDRRLSSADIAIISSASAMHDIGKIAIPDGILLKEGPLTPAERLVMEKHTTKGCEIINSIKEIQDQDYYKYGYEICRHHHERYDGNGYPDRLKGEEIPLSAQVVALADVYDALVNERCYKPAYTFEQSYQMIMNGECGVFSPRLLKCLELAKEDMEIFNMSMQQNVLEITDECICAKDK